MPPRLFVYRIVTDSGVAPHISDNYLTLTLCKPGIRKSAKVGDYILALVALQHGRITGKGEDRYYKAAYLFRVTENVTMEDYEDWCKLHATSKICRGDYFEGNCQYNRSGIYRPGPHNISHKNRNLSGKFSLISNHFAAWTSTKPYTLSDSELDAIELNREQVKKATRNFFTVGLDNQTQIDALEKLIDEWEPQNAGMRHTSRRKRYTRKILHK